MLTFVLEIKKLNPGAGAIASLAQVPPPITHQIFEKVFMMTYHGDVNKIQGVSGSIVATGRCILRRSMPITIPWPMSGLLLKP